MPQEFTEAELLELARKYSFRSRMDRNAVTGPIMVWGRGSIVRDIQGKEYLDFNSGQMCAALGHNHPRIVQALQESAETLIHSHMSMFNDKEIILAARLAEITPEGMDRPRHERFHPLRHLLRLARRIRALRAGPLPHHCPLPVPL